VRENLDLSSSLVEISLHAEFQLIIMPVSGPKVCGCGRRWWCVSQFQC
jgi:hypothetical protein